MLKFDYYIDRKFTIWARERYLVEAESKEEAETIMKGVMDDNNKDDLSYDFEYIYDTSEELQPEYNEGESTRELYESDGTLLLTNKKN